MKSTSTRRQILAILAGAVVSAMATTMISCEEKIWAMSFPLSLRSGKRNPNIKLIDIITRCMDRFEEYHGKKVFFRTECDLRVFESYDSNLNPKAEVIAYFYVDRVNMPPEKFLEDFKTVIRANS